MFNVIGEVIYGLKNKILCANHDSIFEARKLGIDPQQSLDFNNNNIKETMETVSITLTQRSQGTPVSLRQISNHF